MIIKHLKSKIHTIILTALIALFFGANGYAQKSQKEVLYDTWYLHSYVVGTKEYRPQRKEREDFIQFRSDMTFISKSEGKDEKGTYIVNTNGGYVEFKDENDETLKAFVVSISENTLVLNYDIKELRDIEVHYTKQK